MPTPDAMAAGAWRDRRTYETSYLQADERTMYEVMEANGWPSVGLGVWLAIRETDQHKCTRLIREDLQAPRLGVPGGPSANDWRWYAQHCDEQGKAT